MPNNFKYEAQAIKDINLKQKQLENKIRGLTVLSTDHLYAVTTVNVAPDVSKVTLTSKEWPLYWDAEHPYLWQLDIINYQNGTTGYEGPKLGAMYGGETDPEKV